MNRELVRFYRIIHFAFAASAGAQIKTYTPRPDHTLQFFPHELEIVRYPGGRTYRIASAVSGLQDRAITRILPKDFLCLQIIFQPTALYRLTGIPHRELRNQYIDAEALLGRKVSLVNERLYHCRTYQQMLDVADEFVATLTPRQQASSVDRASRLLLSRDRISIDWLARESALSCRQFGRLFALRTGVGPKLFARIARFDRAYLLKNHYPERDWLAIAVACGYHDYQHLVRDYRDFTGMTPPGFDRVEKASPERTLSLCEDYYETRHEQFKVGAQMNAKQGPMPQSASSG
jgi:AraC-like DNA-binding protein